MERIVINDFNLHNYEVNYRLVKVRALLFQEDNRQGFFFSFPIYLIMLQENQKKNSISYLAFPKLMIQNHST